MRRLGRMMEPLVDGESDPRTALADDRQTGFEQRVDRRRGIQRLERRKVKRRGPPRPPTRGRRGRP